MQSATFRGEVQGGRILTERPLTDFEGKQVYVTLIAPEESPPAQVAEPGHAEPYAPEEPEILEDTGRIRIPPQEVTAVHFDLVDVGRLPMRVYSSDEEA